MNALFPYEKVRDEQDKLLVAVGRTMKNGGSLVVHAPTGLGKTAAALSPALQFAIEHKKTVVFCTSRHTQHQIALETLQRIKERHKLDFETIDIIGKKWLCLQPNATRLRSREFSEYCKALRADKQCEFYEGLKEKEELSKKTKLALKELGGASPLTATQIKDRSRDYGLCPYEISVLLARSAAVIITDYNYIFNPGVADTFLAKIGKEPSDLIVVVDEAHNLPNRVKESASDKLSTFQLSRAASEADKFKYDDLKTVFDDLITLWKRFGLTIEERNDERYIEQQDVVRKIDQIRPIAELIADLERIGDAIREQQQYSYVGAVGAFLKVWVDGGDDGFVRIFSESRYRDEEVFTLSYKCLDPSVVTGPILNACYASVLMSGTLQPTRMYKELMGVLKAEEIALESPFPAENRLSVIIPKTTTKFTSRSDAMYQEIASHCVKVCEAIPGNVAVFFPSYALLNNVKRFFETRVSKTVFSEVGGMSREEKHDFLERFKGYKDSGAVLLGVISGSYGEGIDLPGDELQGVVVVGLPLTRPDLETKALIQYFDNKYGRGWEYGYTFPAFNKTLQSAGRCIRTEKDRGVVVFLDERYETPQYKSCFTADWNPITTVLYEAQIRKFFGTDKKEKTLGDY